MALSPSIPTSFVPKQPTPQNQRRATSGNNIFLLIGVVIFIVALLLCGGVFLYASYLKSVEDTKGAQLVEAEKSVNPDTVQQLVELQQRLTVAKGLIGQHVELSQFFDLLESVTLTNVSYSGLTIQVADDRSATLAITGEAVDFNALAAESKAFAAQPHIKSAIFSNIGINKNGSVTFTVNATLDPAVVVEAAPPIGGAAAAVTQASTTSTAALQSALPTLPPAATSSAASSSASTTTTP